ETGAAPAPGPFFATTVLWAPLGHDGTGTVAFSGDPTMPYVLETDRVDRVAVVVPEGVIVHDAAGLTARPVPTIDWTRRLFELPADASTGAPEPVDSQALLERAWVALSAELLGTTRWLLDATVAYA